MSSIFYNSTSPLNTTGYAFNPEQMRREILLEAAITTELELIRMSGTEDVECIFVASLSAPEVTALNALAAAHIPEDFGIVVEGLTGEASDVALASAELNWFNNENTIFESHTVQDVIEEISSLTWLENLNPTILQGAPILGDPGALGETGVTGPQGPPGPPGPAGAPTGATGAQGDQGTQGNTGSDGDDGPAGNTGAGGATGSDGLVGSTGAAGNTGVAGATGEDGFVGSDGATGATGAAGGTGAGAAPDYFEELTTKTTNKQSWKKYTDWDTPSLAGGTYRFAWHFVYRIEGDEAADIRIRDDNTTELVFVRVDKPNDEQLEQHVSGFKNISLSAGSHNIDLDRRIDGDDSDIKIYEARFELTKVG